MAAGEGRYPFPQGYVGIAKVGDLIFASAENANGLTAELVNYWLFPAASANKARFVRAAKAIGTQTMYPKNAASPEPIAVGTVLQISDGALQTSGVTVRIKPVGVAEADGAGTVSYSTDGVVIYTPTQAETNYTSFTLIAKKTGCYPTGITVVTTSSATPGTVLLAPVTHTSAVIPTVTTTTTATNVTTVNGLAAGVITATSIADNAITDAKVASDVTINSVTGSIGSISGVTFPTNFGATSITAGGIVKADLDTIKTQTVTCSGGVTVPAATLASTTNITAGTLTTVTTTTNLTNLPAITAGWLTDVGISSNAFTRQKFAADSGLQSIRSNTAQSGTATTVVLDTLASAVDDFYNNSIIYITGGTGAGQSRRITDYTGASKTATVDSWITNPDATSTFAILPDGSQGASVTDPWAVSVPGSYTGTQAGKVLADILADTGTDGVVLDNNEITAFVDAVLDTSASGHTTALTLGKALNELLNSSAEPTGAPAANENAIEKLGYLFAALRNQLTVTASSLAFKNDAGTTLWSKALSDDGTTYTEAEGV